MMGVIGTTKATERVASISGQPMSTSKFIVLMHELFPGHISGAPWIVSDEIVAFVAQYWTSWARKKSNRLSIRSWAEKFALEIPRLPRQPGVMAAPRPAVKADSATITLTKTELAGIIRAAVTEAVGKLRPIQPELRLLPGPADKPLPEITRDNDARVRLIEDSIAVFQRDHDISRKTCMAKLKEVALMTHPSWIGIHDNEEWPLYLRKSGHIEEFIRDMPGYLDAIHDSLAKVRVAV